MKPRLVSYREAAVQYAEIEAARHVHEYGYNSGPDVQKYQRATWLSGSGWSWCCAFVVWCFKQAGMRDIRPTAGVGDFFAHYAARGCRVERPLRGDVVCYDWSGRGRFDSHIGFVDRVLSIKLGSRWLMRTCEGNTSASDSGSQDNGDGVYLKKRWVLMHSNDAAFIRLKGGAVIPPSHV